MKGHKEVIVRRYLLGGLLPVVLFCGAPPSTAQVTTDDLRALDLADLIEKIRTLGERTAELEQKLEERTAELEAEALFKTETGIEEISRRQYPDLDLEADRSCKGPERGRVTFEEPFSAAPSVMAGISVLDIPDFSGWRQSVGLTLDVRNVDRHGFTYRFCASRRTGLARARFSWMAVGR